MTPTPQGAERRDRLLAFALLLLALGWLSLPLLDPTLQVGARDAGRMYAPLKHFIGDQLQQGRLAVWNPHVGLGEPLIAAVNPGALDPLNILLLLPFPSAFKLLHLVCYLAAALGMVLFLSRRRFSAQAQVLGASALIASGYLTGIANNFAYLRGLAFVPLFLAAFDWALEPEPRRPVRLAVAGLAWAGLLLGGEPQTWLLAFPTALLLSPASTTSTNWRSIGLILAFGLAFSAPVWLPVALSFSYSDRGALGASAIVSQWWFAPGRLAELVVPYLLDSADPSSNPVYLRHFAAGRPVPWVPSEYLGAVVTLLAGFGLRRGRGRREAVLALVALWLAAGPALGAQQALGWLPIWKTFQFPEKLLGFVALAVALLAATGLDHVCAEPRWTRRLGFSAILGVILAAMALTFAWGAGSDDPLWPNLRVGLVQVMLLLLGIALLGLGLQQRPRALAFCLVALAVVDLGTGNSLRPAMLPKDALDANGPLATWLVQHAPTARVSTPFEAPLPGEPQRGMGEQFRMWSRGLTPLWNVQAGVGNMGWYGGLAQLRYRTLREAGATGFRYLDAAATHGAGFVVVPGPVENLRLIGLDPSKVEVVAADPQIPASLVRIPHRPFAYLAEHVELSDARRALQSVLEPGFVESGRSVVEGAGFSGCPECGPAKVQYPEPARCEVEVAAAGPATLVVNVPPLPGWTFEFDGVEVEPVHANFLASAVAVPAGAHRLVLTYSEPGLAMGLGLAAAAGAVGLLLALRTRRRLSPGSVVG